MITSFKVLDKKFKWKIRFSLLKSHNENKSVGRAIFLQQRVGSKALGGFSKEQVVIDGEQKDKR